MSPGELNSDSQNVLVHGELDIFVVLLKYIAVENSRPFQKVRWFD